MGSITRILRTKDTTRRSILDTALQMIEAKGCDCISMRKLADEIGYTAPVIYDHYKNKEEIYFEIVRKGYMLLNNDIKIASARHKVAALKIEGMWIAYWDFANQHKEIYQLMFGINASCFPKAQITINGEGIYKLFSPAIGSLFKDSENMDKDIQVKFLTYWAFIHGLIAINLVRKDLGDETNRNIIIEGVRNITISIPDSGNNSSN
jgi:AcrR family transcriptional regulator